MASTMSRAPWVSREAAEAPPDEHIRRWTTVWVTIGILVVLVVVGFLLGITGALSSIDTNLGQVVQQIGAEEGGAGADVRPLPGHVEQINTSLTAIDQALKPIPAQADSVIGHLASIDTNLTSVDNLLKDTTGTLNQALSTAQGISATLIAADDPPDGSGVQAIWRRVAVANGVLTFAEADTTNILSGLRSVNGHLKSACDRLALGQDC